MRRDYDRGCWTCRHGQYVALKGYYCKAFDEVMSARLSELSYQCHRYEMHVVNHNRTPQDAEILKSLTTNKTKKK